LPVEVMLAEQQGGRPAVRAVVAVVQLALLDQGGDLILIE
jgi:hypothetical protein